MSHNVSVGTEAKANNANPAGQFAFSGGGILIGWRRCCRTAVRRGSGAPTQSGRCLPGRPLCPVTRGSRLKEPVNHPRDAVVDVDNVAMTEQLLAPFFNPHVCLFRAVNHEAVHFVDWLVKNAPGLENRPLVHTDNQGSEKLIEIEFDEVPVRVPYFQ
jgi:hypothetical protein